MVSTTLFGRNPTVSGNEWVTIESMAHEMSDQTMPAEILWESEPIQGAGASLGRESFEPARIMRDGINLVISGDWVRPNVRHVLMDEGFADASRWNNGSAPRMLDGSSIGALDTLGCLALADLEAALSQDSAPVRVARLPADKADLYSAVRDKAQVVLPEPDRFGLDDLVALFGRGVASLWSDMIGLVSILGLVLANVAATLINPTRWRFTAFITQLDKSAFRAVPIIILIQFVIGGIIAQQSAYQLQLFGADVFAIDLVAILVLREIGVLITAIMVAGRTGSAFTAEIGAMRMREEVDAMRVIGLDPVDVLVVPRVLGLMVALPLLTVIANASALAGGMLLLWIYSGIEPAVFIDRMHSAILLNTVLVGFIKAPFMAMAIGCIACMEGFRVTGSTESLGQRVTAAVVKSIFAVIVMDGVFAIFFAAISF